MSFAALGSVAGAAATQVHGLTAALNTAAKATLALGAASRTVAAAVQDINASAAAGAAASTSSSGAHNDTSAAGKFVDSQLAALQQFSDTIAKVGGPDAVGKFGFATIINDIIGKVKAGTMDINTAINELRRQFGAVYGTIQQQFLNTTDPALRALDLALEQFINSGRLT